MIEKTTHFTHELAKSFQKPKAILFDWDNTIVHTKSLFFDALEHVSFKFSLNKEDILSSREFCENLHLSARDCFPRIFGEKWMEIKKVYDDYLKDKRKEKIHTISGIEDLLKHLMSEEVTLAVVSNKDGPHLREEVAKIEFTKYFYSIIGSYDAEFDKPSAIPAYKALQGLYQISDFNKEDIWLIGDSIADLECAYNAQITPILIGGHQSAIDLAYKKGIKHIIINDHSELLSVYKSIPIKNTL